MGHMILVTRKNYILNLQANFPQLIYRDYIEVWNLRSAYFYICLTISMLMVSCFVCWSPSSVLKWIQTIWHYEKDNFEKSQQSTTKVRKIPRVQRVRITNHKYHISGSNLTVGRRWPNIFYTAALYGLLSVALEQICNSATGRPDVLYERIHQCPAAVYFDYILLWYRIIYYF